MKRNSSFPSTICIKLVLIYLLCHTTKANAQLYSNDVYSKDLVFERADSLVGDKKKNRIFGDVVFIHKDVTFRSDSAHHYESENRFEGYSRVHITQGDSVELKGDTLFYLGNSNLAELYGNVIFRDKETTLYTDHLLYNTVEKKAYYTENGKVIDGENTLTSIEGTYYVKPKTYTFKKDVLIVNPTYKMYSDHMKYYSITSIAEFMGPTHIISADKHLYAEDGEYHSLSKQAFFNKNSVVETLKYILRGDSLFYDDQFDNGSAFHHVALISKTDSLAVFGDKAYRWGALGYSQVYDSAVTVKYDAKDTLFLKADTLKLIDDSSSINDFMIAYKHASYHRPDLQGISDSLVYQFSDSTIWMYHDPVIWNTGNQVTADSIHVKIKDEQLYRFYANVNAFAISQDSLKLFNQITGRDMVAYFSANEIQKIDVLGNAENIYYNVEGDSVMTGMNRVISSDIYIWFENKKMVKIKYNYEPKGKYIPPHELTDEIQRLAGFSWRIEEKPLRKDYKCDLKLLNVMPKEYFRYVKGFL